VLQSRATNVIQGASVQELLVEACRRNNTELLNEVLEDKEDDEISNLLNNTTTVMGNHLYHEAASRGNCMCSALIIDLWFHGARIALEPMAHSHTRCQVLIDELLILPYLTIDEIVDLLLDQPGFECDPVNRVEGDTPLHSAIRWINSEPPAQREFGNALVEMMLEAGSNPRVKNKGGLNALQLVDPRNTGLRELIQKHEYASLNAGDFVSADEVSVSVTANNKKSVPAEEDEDAEFSGSDDEERAEWERRRQGRKRWGGYIADQVLKSQCLRI
jgi:hypothetical protein